MQTPVTTDSRGALCARSSGAEPGDAVAPAVVVAPGVGSLVGQPIFPPRDADAEARRRWLASSPWPEVVFAAAL